MSNIIKKSLWFAIGSIFTVILLVLFNTSSQDFLLSPSSINKCPLIAHDKSDKADINILELDSINWCRPENIINRLNTINLYESDSLTQALIIETYTTKIEKYFESQLNNYNPELLISLLHWAAKMYDCQDVLRENEYRVFRVVSNYWLNQISDRLYVYHANNPSIKYRFDFKYIVAICQARGFFPPIGYSTSEKLVNYLIEQRFGYILSRLWYSTNWFFKGSFALFLTVVIYALYSFFIHAFDKIFKNKN